MDYRVISIGALSRHELWGESEPTRTAHATTTLIRSEKKVILVDPGLPASILSARLKERSGLDASAVTDVFLTCFRPAHRWGLAAFPQAAWLISEMERETVGTTLVERLRQAGEPEERKLLEEEISVLQKCTPAPDHLTPQVDLFPLPGFTPGTCGLLLKLYNSTGLITGDAVATAEHLEQGRVLRDGYDAKQAGESFLEAVEIADVLIPGHDNILLNPTRRPY